MKKIIAYRLFITLTYTLALGQSLKGRLMLNLHNYAPHIPYDFNLPLSSDAFGFTVRTEKVSRRRSSDGLKISRLGASLNAHYFLRKTFLPASTSAAAV